ncbi:MAG: gas vesicle protein GvpG [Longimicrobiales bacterium]
MGLLKHALFWPVTGPSFLVRFSLDQVYGVVREELTDDSSVRAELMELQLLLELGEIDDDAYVTREAALMRRLREIRDWRERFGMGVSGGPVRVTAQQELDEAAEARAGERAEKVAGRDLDAEEAARRGGGMPLPGEATIELSFGDDE